MYATLRSLVPVNCCVFVRWTHLSSAVKLSVHCCAEHLKEKLSGCTGCRGSGTREMGNVKYWSQMGKLNVGMNTRLLCPTRMISWTLEICFA